MKMKPLSHSNNVLLHQEILHTDLHVKKGGEY